MALITVSGNVGFSDFFYSENGNPILIVSIADDRWNHKDKEEETQWIRALWYGEQAEKHKQGLLKSKIIIVTGYERYKIYENKIDRVISPLHYNILAFKKEEDVNRNVNVDTPPSYTDRGIPYK